MATTLAQSGYGATFAIKTGGVFVDVAEVTSITVPSLSRDTIDTTHLKSPDQTKEFIGSLIEAGEASININYVPAVVDVLMQAFTTNRGAGEFRITYPLGDIQMTFSGIVTGYEQSEIVVDGKLSASFKVKCSGKPVISAAVAPMSLQIPAVIGQAKVGVAMTVYEGVWSGVAAFTYQWRVDGVDVPGAIDATYTPVVGNVGKAVTVRVTGSNPVGSASATSAASANVVA